MIEPELKANIMQLVHVMHTHGISQRKIHFVVTGYFNADISLRQLTTWMSDANMTVWHTPFRKSA